MLKKIEHCNVEALLGVKARILSEPENLNMAHYSCDTARCIAGWAVELARMNPEAEYCHKKATEILGLDVDVADALFLVRPMGRGITPWCMSRITADEACQAIDNVIQHNDPKWEEVLDHA